MSDKAIRILGKSGPSRDSLAAAAASLTVLLSRQGPARAAFLGALALLALRACREDRAERRVSLSALGMILALCLIGSFAFGYSGRAYSLGLAALPLAAAKLACPGQIGAGDLVFAGSLALVTAPLLVLPALLLACLAALAYLLSDRKERMEDPLPFIPFLTLGFGLAGLLGVLTAPALPLA